MEVQVLLIWRVANLPTPASLPVKELSHWCFSVSYAKFSEQPFYRKSSMDSSFFTLKKSCQFFTVMKPLREHFHVERFDIFQKEQLYIYFPIPNRKKNVDSIYCSRQFTISQKVYHYHFCTWYLLNGRTYLNKPVFLKHVEVAWKKDEQQELNILLAHTCFTSEVKTIKKHL